MGKRYIAVFESLKIQWLGFEKNFEFKNNWQDQLGQCSHIIIATPTNTHMRLLIQLDKFGKPLLCEKPITKTPEEFRLIRSVQSPLTMVMQYVETESSHAESPTTHYDYFRHGNDGLAWDCTQIIALAKGAFSISESSPIWDCVINGRRIHIQSMDAAYVKFIRNWLEGKKYHTRHDLIAYHELVANAEKRQRGGKIDSSNNVLF